MEVRSRGPEGSHRGLLGCLLRMRSIKIKLLIPLMVLTAITGCVTLGFSIWRFAAYALEQGVNHSRDSLQAVRVELDQLLESASYQAELLAGDEAMGKGVERGDPKLLKESVESLFHPDEADGFLISGAGGEVLFSTVEGILPGDNLTGLYPVDQALKGEKAASMESYREERLVLLGTAAVRDGQGKVIGTVSACYLPENNKLADRYKEDFNSEYTFIFGGARYSTTLRGEDGQRLVGTGIYDEVQEMLEGGRDFVGKVTIEGSEYFVTYTPLRNGQKEIIGGLFAGERTTAYQRALRSFVTINLATSLLILTVFVLLFSRLIKIILERPLQQLTNLSERVAAGDLNVDVTIQNRDAIGDVAVAFRLLRDATATQARLLEQVAEGNYAITPVVRSPQDMMGLSIQRVVETGRQLFERIQDVFDSLMEQIQILETTSAQVSAGSAEQTASINSIAAMAKDVNDLAAVSALNISSTREFGIGMRDTAVTQSGQMDQMVGAVRDINQAAQGISQIIQMINGIATQTNLLALNASIEAARAGQHGKGFAVVANEVKGLATRSAQAAQDTEEMIQTAMDKAATGVHIAEESKDKLDMIESTIVKTSELLEEIQQLIVQEERGIRQITQDIDMVRGVVNRNDALAKESDDACRVMIRHARELELLLSQFHLSDHPPQAQARGPSPVLVGEREDALSYGQDKY